MRKIEQQMLNAIHAKKDFISGNTAVFFISATESGNPFGSRSEVFLHGNHIADYWHESSSLEVDCRTLAQWATVTTKSRLRALGAKVRTCKGITYLNNVAV